MTRILIELTLKSGDFLGCINILITSDNRTYFPIIKHGCLPFYYVSFNFLSLMFVQLSVYMSFISLDKFIHMYFNLLDIILNEISFLIFLLDCLMVAYRYTTDFCVLVLKPVTLLNLFISFSIFLDFFSFFLSIG